MNTVPPQMIRIAVAGGTGDADALHAETVPTPAPGPGEILIRVEAAGVNRPDIIQRQGKYPPPPGAPDTLGMEVAGVVVALGDGAAGDGAARWRVGDPVCALLGGGGYAQYAAVDARCALPIPDGLDMIQAASLPEVAFTVWSNVFERGRLAAGETLLLHGATSGIGVMAIALAKAAGARVIATSRGEGKARTARDLGADIAIDTDAQDFAVEAKAAGGVDVVLDMVGAAFLQKNLEVLNVDGRLVQIAFLTGAKGEFDLSWMLPRRLSLIASTLRARSAEEKARLAAAVEANVWPWIVEGLVKPRIDRVFPLEEAGAAHAWLEAGEHVGKVMLRV